MYSVIPTSSLSALLQPEANLLTESGLANEFSALLCFAAELDRFQQSTLCLTALILVLQLLSEDVGLGSSVASGFEAVSGLVRKLFNDYLAFCFFSGVSGFVYLFGDFTISLHGDKALLSAGDLTLSLREGDLLLSRLISGFEGCQLIIFTLCSLGLSLSASNSETLAATRLLYCQTGVATVYYFIEESMVVLSFCGDSDFFIIGILCDYAVIT